MFCSELKIFKNELVDLYFKELDSKELDSKELGVLGYLLGGLGYLLGVPI